MSMKQEKRIASVETKRQSKIFGSALWKKVDIIENKLFDYYKKGRRRKRLYVGVRPVSYQMMIFVLFELSGSIQIMSMLNTCTQT